MNKLTYGDVKSVIAKAAGICLSPSSRVAGYLNEATQRLMNRGKWVGTYGRFEICVTDGCLTWPRQIQTIEAYAVCGSPGTVRNEWFEFLESGPGLLGDCGGGCSSTLVDRGTSPVFNDITRGQVNRKVRVYSDIVEDAGSKIIVQGYDENGNWIRTSPDGVNYIDGVEILLAVSPGTISSKFFSAVTGVIKPVTDGFVRLYEYNNTTAANVQIMAIYEPDETLPNYRRSLIPGVSGGGGDCGQTKLTVQAKLRFIPVSGTDDNQWVMLGNLGALKLAVQGITFEEKNMPEQAEIYLLKAVRELERELEVYYGDGVVHVPRVMSSNCWGGGGINLNI